MNKGSQPSVNSSCCLSTVALANRDGTTRELFIPRVILLTVGNSGTVAGRISFLSLKQLKPPAVINSVYRFRCRCPRLPIFCHVTFSSIHRNANIELSRGSSSIIFSCVTSFSSRAGVLFIGFPIVFCLLKSLVFSPSRLKSSSPQISFKLSFCSQDISQQSVLVMRYSSQAYALGYREGFVG